ncbi:MAG: type II toxin-antitoxin system VapC family toxin [Terracidiphilus sp.]
MSFYFLEATAFAMLFVREPGTNLLIRLMESVEDNSKLISAATPLEVYAAIRRRERTGQIAPDAAITALELLRVEAARMVQQPLNPGVLEAARQLLDRTALRWPEALQLGAALAARDMFPGTHITFVSASTSLLEAAQAEGLDAIDPAKLPPPEEDLLKETE